MFYPIIYVSYVLITSYAGRPGRDSVCPTRGPLFRQSRQRLRSGNMRRSTWFSKHLQMTELRTDSTFVGTVVLRAGGVSRHKGKRLSLTRHRSRTRLPHNLELRTTQWYVVAFVHYRYMWNTFNGSNALAYSFNRPSLWNRFTLSPTRCYRDWRRGLSTSGRTT